MPASLFWGATFLKVHSLLFRSLQLVRASAKIFSLEYYVKKMSHVISSRTLASYLEGRSPVSPLSCRCQPETTSLGTAARTGPLSPQNAAALGCRSVCSPRKSAQHTHTYCESCPTDATCNTPSLASFTHLGQAGLQVHDEIPLLPIQAVRHLVLPNERTVICGGPASCVSSSRSLCDYATHRLRHPEVHLRRLDLDECTRGYGLMAAVVCLC